MVYVSVAIFEHKLIQLSRKRKSGHTWLWYVPIPNVYYRGHSTMLTRLCTGWAGFTLARRLDASKYKAIVVSPRSYFVFTPLLASTSVGTLEFRTALEPIRSRRKPVEFFQGWADTVDFARKTIQVEEAVDDARQGLALTGEHIKGKKEVEEMRKKGKVFELGYDKLVVTVGSYSQTFGTPGVREHALFLKDVGDARRIRNRLLSCFETANLPTTSETMRKNLLNFAVVGGGRMFMQCLSASLGPH
jgi:NADH dehydrogenase FAD-containing subunit